MKLQCITVSVKYADFLIHTLEENAKLFDKWIIVTDTKDQETKNLCSNYKNIQCIQTDVFYENGAKFKKFAGVNEGLKYVDKDAWVLFLDSDIVLHSQTKRILENVNLDPTFIYGIDRVNCVGRQAWDDYKKARDLVIHNWLLTDAGFKLGSRLVHYYGYEGGDGKFAGWNPIGFFQLAHRSSFDSYPQNSVGADHCDLVFARQWPRNRRMLIPEIMAIHLESNFLVRGTNWYGRLSLPFTLEAKPTFKYFLNVLYRRLLIAKRSFFRRHVY